EKYVKPNISTNKINDICHEYITYQQKSIPACLGYHGFPKSICISINDVVCHGIPSERTILKEGDIVNIDITVIKNGYHGDTSKMFYVGEIGILAKRLC
ncbi:MAG: M24 family metallopeptidase, partial [Candidatus Blochmannia sp. A2]|nr:M24 family metallopeptidase [Candidatus Blochmannia sp. A2]